MIIEHARTPVRGRRLEERVQRVRFHVRAERGGPR